MVKMDRINLRGLADADKQNEGDDAAWLSFALLTKWLELQGREPEVAASRQKRTGESG